MPVSRAEGPSGGNPSGEQGLVAEPLTNDGRPAEVLEWAEAAQRLAAQRYYWVATVSARGQPQVRPVLAVRLGSAMYTTSKPTARKARNLGSNPRCSLIADSGDIHLVVEGVATPVSDAGTLDAVAAYREKYDWPVVVESGLFDAPYGVPTAGPPPYQLFEVRPTAVFAFVAGGDFGPASTRWLFD
jgi:hypothetical protein